MKYYCKIYIMKTEEIEVNAKNYASAKLKALDMYANNKTFTCDEEVDEVKISQVG